jgi:hypothetical protein
MTVKIYRAKKRFFALSFCMGVFPTTMNVLFPNPAVSAAQRDAYDILFFTPLIYFLFLRVVVTSNTELK